ncbi:MAG: DUF2845 domain-containing protein [Desulfobacterales bacterium]
MKRACKAFILELGLILGPSLSLSGIGEFKETLMRCGNSLIDIGDSKSRVAYLCGQPISKEIVGRTEIPENQKAAEFILERWTYDTSPQYFTILTFKGDRLIRMEDERKW